MAVSHPYHCASDQLQGGKAGKGVVTLCLFTLISKWATGGNERGDVLTQ